jgi:hypothetical protein
MDRVRATTPGLCHGRGPPAPASQREGENFAREEALSRSISLPAQFVGKGQGGGRSARDHPSLPACDYTAAAVHSSTDAPAEAEQTYSLGSSPVAAW